MSDFFEDSDLVYAYTRAQAIADGVLIDVSEMAKEAGITFPVALTSSVYADVCNIPPSKSHQDPKGRLWDLLTMFVSNARKFRSSQFSYDFIMHVGNKTYYTVKAVCSPGDDCEPVVTLMLPNED